jgi:threonine aldolase
MVWLDLEATGCSEKRFIELGAEVGLKFMGGRLVTHYQVAQNGDEVLKRLKVVFEKVLGESQDSSEGQKVGKGSVYVPQ